MKKSLRSAMLLILAMAFSCPAWAAVSGPCANCHTMHATDGAGSMIAGGPKPTLLTKDCLGCHTGTDNWKDSVTGAPIVYNTTEPGTYLAGGNFYWVKTQDAKGHNVFSDNADSLSGPPGNLNGISCGVNTCHENLHAEVSGLGGAFSGLNGRQGCTGCHMIEREVSPGVWSSDPKGFHHANDGVPGTTYLVNSGDQGWYRFLAGHMGGSGHGVSGIEDADWQHTKGATDHNEYLGVVGAHGSTTNFSLGHTMTAYCCGCHGNFHIQDTGSGWVRHPSDAVLPTDGEYSAYTTYDPLVPVARASLSGVTSTVSGLNGDMVMCLSCHVPHGSPNDDLLRWDYNGMVAGGGGDDGTGCFVCHTEKDGII